MFLHIRTHWTYYNIGSSEHTLAVTELQNGDAVCTLYQKKKNILRYLHLYLIIFLLFYYTVLYPSFFFITKPTTCINFTNLWGMKLYMFRTVRLSIIRSLLTVNSTVVGLYVVQVCRQLSSRTILILLESCLQPAPLKIVLFFRSYKLPFLKMHRTKYLYLVYILCQIRSGHSLLQSHLMIR